MAKKGLTLEDKINLVKLRPFRESHLAIRDQRICRDCVRRECTTVCPVKTYTWEDGERKVVVSFENCFECGTCRLACPFENIEWKYPPGSFGVEFVWG